MIKHFFRNCLFRALGDQIDGYSFRHLHHREQTVKYMVEHRNDFEPFVEDDCTFDDHGAFNMHEKSKIVVPI